MSKKSTSDLSMKTNINTGLTEDEVNERIDKGLYNKNIAPPSKTVGQIICHNTFTYFNFIFLILAFLVVITGYFQNLLFTVPIIINILIGTIQEIKAKHVIDKLTLISTPEVEVLRNSEILSIDVEKLVVDDIMLLASGKQICADGIVVEGEIEVNESMITGESDAIIKKVGDVLYSGSFVISGKCKAGVTGVGENSFVAKLTKEAKIQKKAESEMIRSLNSLIKFIGVAIIPLGIITFIKTLSIMDGMWQKAMVKTVVTIVGLIPEGLYLLVSVALAVSVVRLAKDKVLVHELSCIETLARVDTLCLDKTGTITSGNMNVNDVIMISDDIDRTYVFNVASAFYKHTDDNNDTAQAMKRQFNGSSDLSFVRNIPFSSARKWSAVIFSDSAFMVGAPEIMLGEKFDDYSDILSKHLSDGDRVLLFAEGEHDGESLKVKQPLAFICVQDEIRQEAPETLNYFREQGVDIKIISGDNPYTVSQIANRAGVVNAEKYVDARELEDENAIAQAVDEYTIFGRVTPDQKRTIVQSLQAKKHTVAMTGDGVNDVLALKDADCSVAMASGSDAACQVSNLVLLNSDFSAMPKVVYEGRRVINNIERGATLFLVKTIFSSIFAIISLFLPIVHPLMPVQLSLIGGLTIGIPSLVLALEPNKERISGKFLTNVLTKAFPGGITGAICMILVPLVCGSLGFTSEEISTVTTITLGFNGLLVLFFVCKPLSIKHFILLFSMLALFTLMITLFPNLLMLEPLTLELLMTIICSMAVCALILFAADFVLRKKLGHTLGSKIDNAVDKGNK